jgi:hypothetical protein
VGVRRFVVERGNRRLNLVGTGGAARERTLQDLSAFRNTPLIPQRSNLLVERDQLSIRTGAGGAPGVRQQHQREQAADLGILRQQLREQAGDANRFR